MLPHIKFPRPAMAFRGTRKQLPGLANNAASSFTEEELNELHKDLSETMAIRGAEDASNVVPPGLLRDRIKSLGDTTNKRQAAEGAKGAAGQGLLGAGMGAVTTGLASGLQAAPVGLLGAIPGAIRGYNTGRHESTKKQLREALTEELGPGAGIKKANIEPGFKEVLRHLHEYKKQGKLTPAEFSQAIRDLKDARGHNMTPPERLIIRRVILERKDLPKPVFNVPKGRPGVELPDPWPSKTPNLPQPAGKSISPQPAVKNTRPILPAPKKPNFKPYKYLSKRNVGIAAGVTAALSALGLGAAAFWPRDDDSVVKD